MFAGFGPSEMIEEFPRTRFDEFSENYFLSLISDNVRRSRSVSAQSTDDLSPILAQTNSASARIPDSSRSRQQASRLRQLQLTDSSRPQPQSVRGPIAVSSRPVRVPVCGSSLWWSVQQTSKVKGNSKPKNP
ncbi:hypothetical protein F2Q69_00050097 [Brassica cretica]|uniref:Uncharacterized protein n=1 Tax=Brassica cretica TaxID=69181 RepID=A0A8S9PUU4_BRACR|nr:hypothetical protein F2Q69_00050097 [Brassica cretica]